MKKDATQKSVSDREKALERIRKDREAERAQALADLNLDDEHPPTPEEVEEAKLKEEGILPETEVQDNSVVFFDSDGNEYRVPVNASTRLKIDGKELETSLDQISRRYQKGAAGDVRLQEASEARRQLQEKEAELSRREAEFLNKLQQADQANAEGDLSDDDHSSKVRELIEALVEADEDRAAELLPKLLKGRSQVSPVIMEEKVASIVDDRIQIQEKNRSLKQARDRFFKDYKDLAEDPTLFSAVDQQTALIIKDRPNADPWEVIKEAADKVVEWRDGLVGKSSRSVRSEAKKRSVPTPVSGRAKIGEDPKPPMTREERLNAMRVSRGQPAI